MRILILCHEFPPVGGGAAKACREIALNLAARGHEVEVLTGAPPAGVRLDPSPGVQVRTVEVGRRYLATGRLPEMALYTLHAYRDLRHRIPSTGSPDLILSFFALPAGIVGASLRRRARAAHVITLRGMDIPGYDPENLARLHVVLGPILRLITRNADLLIPNGTHLQHLLERDWQVHHPSCSLPPIRSIANGIDCKYDPELPDIPRSDEIRFRLLACGRFAGQKNFSLFFSALEHLQHLQPYPLEIEMIGDGPLRAALQEHATQLQARFPIRIRFHGWLERDRVQDAMKTVDLLVQPSGDEGISNSILEAFSTGIPVVTSDCGGNREIVRDGENGFLFPPGNVGKLAECLATAIRLRTESPQEWRLIRENAFRQAKGRSWNAVGAEFEAALSEALFLFRSRTAVGGHVGEAGLGVATKVHDKRLLQRAP